MKITCEIKGLSPLLINAFTSENEIAAGTGISSAIKSGQKLLPREQAEKKLYQDKNGKLFIPGPNIFSCLVEAGRHIKAGKRQLTTAITSLVPAGLQIEEIVLPLKHEGWEVDVRSVVNPSTRGRFLCYRPRLDAWSLSFTLEIDEEMFSEATVRQLVDIAGKRLGLGDFRPQRKGPFGRFVVVSWKVSK